MPINNLNLTVAAQTTIGITEDILSQGNRSTVSVSIASTKILDPNSNRGNYTIYNDSTITAFIAHNTSVSASSYEFPLPGGMMYYPDFSSGRYLGQVSGITAASTATIRVVEFTII